MLKLNFIALPKKADTTECEHYRTYSSMSQVTKILFSIVMMRVRQKIRPKIVEEKRGFLKGMGMSNAIFMLRTMNERALKVQKELCLSYIDYTKAVDRGKHMEILNQLQKLSC